MTKPTDVPGTGGSDDLDDVHDEAAVEAAPAARPAGLFSRARKKLPGVLALSLALGAVGIGYSALAPSSTAADTASPSDLKAGQQLYETACITCHGRNLQGVQNRGVSLLGTGEAATYFQVGTGRMPLVKQGAQADEKPARYTDEQVRQLAAYVQSVGGGTQIPEGDLRDNAHMAEGGELFRLNCAQCHNFAGKGGALSSGKHAPTLAESSDAIIYAAMLTGPENMPVFGDNQITPDQKRAIVAYVQTLKETRDPGGSGLGRLGPVSEGLVIWIIGIGGLMFAVLWIGAKS